MPTIEIAVSSHATQSELDALNAVLARPFERVPLAARCTLFALWQEGHPVEWRHVLNDAGKWQRGTPAWDAGFVYRAAMRPVVTTLPSIDWSAVSPAWTWLAQDPDGKLSLFSDMPHIKDGGEIWSRTGDARWMAADCFASARPGKGDWKLMTVTRPMQ
ncbi:hypothetical protein [Paraburkholderia sp. J8-2]|uniref:hypothetical protein n=1 Tax=Paraburkholderia sp. J8-2 TaxID=2805440 RepID=UPI002AB5F3DD|nr:hypothetical protein [Paraburkholderia sp. J8-2]